MDVDIRHRLGLLLKHAVGFQRVEELEHVDVGAHSGEVYRRLDTGVAAADDGYTSSGIEGAVAMRAESHSVADMLFFAGNGELAPSGSRGDDECSRPKGFIPADEHLLRA